MKKQLIIAGAVIFVIAAIFLGIHFFKKECVALEITFEPEKPQAGQTVSFKIKGANGEKLNWDFSDGDTFSGADSAIHKFDNSGSYIISVVTENNCEGQREIIVDPARKIQRVTPLVSYPPEILVGEEVTFTDATKEANEWSWKIPETNESSNFSSFTTTFPHAGIYNISLTVKGIYIKGDTTIAFNVVTEHGANPQLASPTPEPVAAAKPKPEAMPKPESKSRKKPEEVAKPKPSPVAANPKPQPLAKAEPKPKPVAEPKVTPEPKAVKPVPVAKPKPSAPVYMKDSEFSSTFIEIANSLGEDDNNSSADWTEKIIPQAGPGGTIKLVVIESTGEPKEMSLESFKKKQIIASTPFVVNQVKDIKRKKDNAIYQITLLVTKN